MDITFLSELLEKGGIVMGLLLLLSVYVVAVVLYKLFQLWRYRSGDTSFLEGVLSALEGKKPADAVRIAANAHGPVADIATVTLHTLSNKKIAQESREKLVEVSGVHTLQQLESHMRGLELAANISPLLGLLGTVIGMVKAFSNIEQVGSRVDPSMLAGGIWEALLTTVAGLSVAVPALIAYYLIGGHIEKIRSRMQEAVTLILARQKA